GPIAEKVGLLKMDFLGLRTLTTLQRSIDLVKQTKGIEVDIESIDFTDKKVLDLFCRGETRGIFQFESGGMTDLLMKMQPDRLEDLIAANALYRPGPMELIPLYCNLKNGREKVQLVHPIMDEILKETYGIMVYQEQVMQIFNQLGGIELSAAYKLIKAISKKTKDVIGKFEPQFIAGCVKNGIAKPQAAEIFELILKFGGYGFNKSHSTRYAIIAFQTAYMKTYHPIEYMAALLTFEMGSTDKVVEYIEECRRMNVEVLPPDVNVSDKDFTPIYEAKGARGKRQEGVIRFGMCAVRGVGEKAVEAIIEQREKAGQYSSLYEFCERVDLRQVQRSTMEALVKCGAFSSISEKRAPLLYVLESAIEMALQHQQDKRNGQLNMFMAEASTGGKKTADTLPAIDELPRAELLKFEKELLGFYITSHPLTDHQAALERYGTHTTRESLNCPENMEVVIGGMICAVRSRIAKSGRSAGQKWAIVEIEDLEGKIEGIIFSDLFAQLTEQNPDLIKAESICFVRGKIDRKRETPCIVISDVIPIADAAARLTTAVALKLQHEKHDEDSLKKIAPLLAKHKGNCELYTQVQMPDSRKVVLRVNKEFYVRPTDQLVSDLDSLLGNGTVQFFGAGQKRRKRLQQQQQMFQEETAPSDVVDTGVEEPPVEMALTTSADKELE
ncbi:MAG TPA: DNA polymerase III subunit alpha, partial [Tepidisphaeraceae bacterium]